MSLRAALPLVSRVTRAVRPKASRVPPIRLRCFSSDVAVQDGLTTGEDLLEPPWLALRVNPPPGLLDVSNAVEVAVKQASPTPAAAPLLDPRAPRQKLLTASVEDVLLEAFKTLAYGGPKKEEDWRPRWLLAAKHLLSRELTAEQAFLAFHCIVKIGYFEPKPLQKLLEKVVDRIECQYFSARLGLDLHFGRPDPSHDEVSSQLRTILRPKPDPSSEVSSPLLTILRAFTLDENESFQSLVNCMPLGHKVQLILIHSGRPLRGFRGEKRAPATPEDIGKQATLAKRQWKTVDPVEMEEWERERYFKGRFKVLRMPHVEAKVRRTAPGKRLRATLASQLFEVLPTADAATLAEISQVCFFPQRLLTGDLQLDFQEALAKRIASLDRHHTLPYLLCFFAALRSCEGAEAYRTLRKRLLPDLRWLMRANKRQGILQNQRFVRPLLQFKDTEGVQDRLDELAELCARLVISVCGARQIQMDAEMLDALSAPLEEVLADMLQEVRAGSSRSTLSTETLADLLSVLVTCKVQPRVQLMDLLLEVVLCGGAELWGPGGADASDEDEDREEGDRNKFGDLCVTAHALSLLHDRSEAALALLWSAALPTLQRCSGTASLSPALTVALLDAVLRGAAEDLVMSQAVRSAFDEFVVQRVDLDSSALGHIGV